MAKRPLPPPPFGGGGGGGGGGRRQFGSCGAAAAAAAALGLGGGSGSGVVYKIISVLRLQCDLRVASTVSNMVGHVLVEVGMMNVSARTS